MRYSEWKPRAVIIDIDGVLACNLHRLKHVHDNREQPDWDAFYRDIEEDPVLPVGQSIADLAYQAGLHVILVTNRPAWLREATERWLKRHAVPHDELRVRQEGERYENAKVIHLKEILQEYDVYFAVDDDPEHIKMYEEHGVKPIYVHSGYYDGGRVPDDKIVR